MSDLDPVEQVLVCVRHCALWNGVDIAVHGSYGILGCPLFPRLLSEPFELSDSTQLCMRTALRPLSAPCSRGFDHRSSGRRRLCYVRAVSGHYIGGRCRSVTATSSRRLDAQLCVFIVQPDLYCHHPLSWIPCVRRCPCTTTGW